MIALEGLIEPAHQNVACRRHEHSLTVILLPFPLSSNEVAVDESFGVDDLQREDELGEFMQSVLLVKFLAGIPHFIA